jgi:6-phosphogluconolactonase
MRTDLRYRCTVLPTAPALALDAALRIARAASAAVAARGEFVVALSGGTTPRGVYENLAVAPYVSSVPWSKVVVLWGDERSVPPDHAASNYRMAREALLDHVPIPQANVHRIRGEDDPGTAARAYEQTLRSVLRTPRGPPRVAAAARIDLVLLGLGDDGHTASLFPGATSPAASDAAPWVIAQRVPADPPWRVSLTPVIINAAREILFLVSGAGKAAIVRQVIEGPLRPNELPAQLIAPTDGRVHWLLDAAAAPELDRPSS